MQHRALITVRSESIALSGAADAIRAFAPPLCQRLRDQLGAEMEPERDVHIVLSDRTTHEARFPARSAGLADLVDEGTRDELDAASLASVFPERFYAHGIATVAAPSLHLPSGVAEGDWAICLDVETITELAAELDVSELAVLMQTLAHELSHVYRRHPETSRATATHGWLHEGDAQRDALAVTTELLDDQLWSNLARLARIAQAKLAARQPPAYRQFAMSASEQAHLATPASPPDHWLICPPRSIHVLGRDEDIEIPIKSVRDGVPLPGDTVTLVSRDGCVGNWVVVGHSSRSRHAHPVDMRAASSLAPPTLVWLLLTRWSRSPLVYHPPLPDRPFSPTVDARRASGAELGHLAAAASMDLAEASARWGDEQVAEHEQELQELREHHHAHPTERGAGVIAMLEQQRDPFDDRTWPG